MNSVLELQFFVTDDACNGKKIRGGISERTGEEIWSVYDFINMASDREIGDNYARNVFFKLIQRDSPFAKEVISRRDYVKVAGQGQRDTPAMTLNGLLYLFAILESKLAEKYRILARDTIMRVLSGDRSLINIIEGNAESSGPLQEACRKALRNEPADDTLEQVCGTKRKFVENEEAYSDRLAKIYRQNAQTLQDHFKFLLKQQLDGVIGMNTFMQLKEQAVINMFPKHMLQLTNGPATRAAHVPTINPFLIWFSALINFIGQDITERKLDVGATAPLKVRLSVLDLEESYHQYYQFTTESFISGAEASINIDLKTLVVLAEDSPHRTQIKKLLLAQHDPTKMTPVNNIYFSKTVRELFGNKIDIQMGKMQDDKHNARVYTFGLLDVKKHLEVGNYHSDYDATVCLDAAIRYEMVSTSSSTCYWS